MFLTCKPNRGLSPSTKEWYEHWMRFPMLHKFLCWAGPTFLVFIGTIISLIIAAAQRWDGVAIWAESWFHWLEPTVTAPWFWLVSALLFVGYCWATIYTGLSVSTKTGLAAIKPMTRREKKADDEFRRQIADASLEEAKQLLEAELEKLHAAKKTVWERAQKLVDPARLRSFLHFLTRQNDRTAVGTAETTFEAGAAKAAHGPDFPKLGKTILNPCQGEAAAFPYRKAVLQVTEIKATAMRHAGAASPASIGCYIDLENKTKHSFKECRIRLVSIDGEAVDGDSFLRIGPLREGKTETVFTTYHHSKKRINFMKRDLEDVVSNPPFLLCLNDRDLPLSDGREYQFVFALECEYEHPTYAKVRFLIPEREKIEIELVAQCLDNPDEQT